MKSCKFMTINLKKEAGEGIMVYSGYNVGENRNEKSMDVP